MVKEGGEEYATLRKSHPNLKQGNFFRLKCMINYELTREILSYGQGIIVLSPTSFREKIAEHITSIQENYNKTN